MIETERLVLTLPTLDDFEDSVALWGDTDVTRFIGGKPSTREEVWARLHRYVGHWQLLGFGFWAVREKASGRFVGEVGTADFHRDIDPPFGGDPECGWALMTWAQGLGYGSEAVMAALDWRDAHLAGDRTVCLIAPDNAPSLRLAARCGFSAYGEADYKGHPSILLERKRPSSTGA